MTLLLAAQVFCERSHSFKCVSAFAERDSFLYKRRPLLLLMFIYSNQTKAPSCQRKLLQQQTKGRSLQTDFLLSIDKRRQLNNLSSSLDSSRSFVRRLILFILFVLFFFFSVIALKKILLMVQILLIIHTEALECSKIECEN